MRKFTMSWIDIKAHAELARVRDARKRQVYGFHREFELAGIHNQVGGRPVTNFSSNDYLGLTNHPKVKEAARRAVDKHACGLSSSRLQATTVEHVELEKRFARWMGFESCLLFTTGYQAMLGTIVALADKDTTLVLDAYSHACILDGAFLAAGVPKNGPEVRFFNHNSAKSL
jgi:glycine C-acetyltransferase